MHRIDACAESEDGLAWRPGKKDGEIYYHNGVDYWIQTESGVKQAKWSECIKYADWRPNKPRSKNDKT